MPEFIRKGYVAPSARIQATTTQVPLREGYAAPATPPQPNVPTTARPVSAVPPPPK
ncbi:MAG TPA: hypothetical protein VFE17_04750 [Candidatus Baltobacteraceae bacterium]|nr:hypothetical protein [Candidatus Baltobacteraceae bacterium]